MRPFFHLPSVRGCSENEASLIDGVSLDAILGYGYSPVYVTALSAVKQRVEAYQSALKRHFPKNEIYYAMKANYAPAILKEVQSTGAGVDIVSIGEWHAALNAGFSPEKVCFAGVGKREQEWRTAIDGKVGFINVEQTAELSSILAYLNELPLVSTHLAVRLNPCVEIETHPHLRTGSLDSKFGLLAEQILMWVTEQRGRFSSQELWKKFVAPWQGLHVHIGSQLLNPEVFSHVVVKLLEVADALVEQGIPIQHLDLGGGLGVGINGVPSDASDIKNHVQLLCAELLAGGKHFPKLQKAWGEAFEKLTVCLEPGRSIVASSTVLLTRVLYEKSNGPDIHFCYVDAGMNDFPRPAIYGAAHEIALVCPSQSAAREKKNASVNYHVVGPVCESGDVFSKSAKLPLLVPDDILAFFEGGAYCRSMASHYNLRALPAEIFLKAGQVIEVIPPINSFPARV
jgi:diaminopimelate decarboxylase